MNPTNLALKLGELSALLPFWERKLARKGDMEQVSVFFFLQV